MIVGTDEPRLRPRGLRCAAWMVPTIKGLERPVLKVVPNADLPKLFEAGWTFKASLGDGQSIVEAPAGAWVDVVKTDTMKRTSKES